MTTRNRHYREREPSLLNKLFFAALGIVVLAVFGSMLYFMWKPVVTGDTGASAQATATAVPTERPRPTPLPYVEPAPVLVQSVPQGQAPQPIVIQPQPAPVVVDSAAPAVEPPPRLLIIKHQVTADGTHQVITGSGACKVTRVAARCSK